MKQIKYENNTITYPNEFKDITFKQYLEITQYISNSSETNLKILIFDLLNNLIEIDGDILVDDLPVSIGKDLVKEVSDVIKEINNYTIDTNPKVNKQILSTGSKTIKVEDRFFIFENDLSKMKMSKYIELELLLGDTTKTPVELLTGLIGSLFKEVIKNNDEIIYLNTEESTIIEYLLKAKAIDIIKYINFFLSIATGSKKGSKMSSSQTRNTKQK